MMVFRKCSLFGLAFSLFSFSLFAQQGLEQYLYKDKGINPAKPPIDFAAIDGWQWMSPSKVHISDDGHYWSYVIAAPGLGTPKIIIQSTAGEVRYEIKGSQPGIFSGDSRWYVYQSKDSLFFLPMGTGQPRQVVAVAGYQTNQRVKSDKISWLAYQLKDSARTLVLHHFQSGREERITGVTGYSFDGSGHWLVCRQGDGGLLLHSLTRSPSRQVPGVSQYLLDKSGKILICITKDATGQQIGRINLADGQIITLWDSPDPAVTAGSLAIDDTGNLLLFIVKEKKGTSGVSSIWYYGPGMVRAEQRLRDGSPDIDEGLYIDDAISFSDNGRYIITRLKPLPAVERKARPGAVPVDIWHYRDTVLQSVQLLYGKSNYRHPWLEPKSYRAVLGANGGRLIRLEGEYERSGLIVGDLAVVQEQDKLFSADLETEGEDYTDSVWLVSLKDGKRRFWRKDYPGTSLLLSTGGRYLLWFDRTKGHYFTHDLQTGREVNISAAVPVYLGSEIAVDAGSTLNDGRTGIIGWLAGDAGLLVYDSYDIWQLDPAGIKVPLCITNGYGRRNGITLRLTEGAGNSVIDNRQLLSSDHDLLFTAFNTRTMENGFYRVSIKQPGDPEKLYMGGCVMDLTKELVHNNGDLPIGRMAPVKARDAKVWIVSRQSTAEAPNYYVTRNFKTYKALTDVQPHQRYNWMSRELIHFKQMDGSMSQGVLYKPENFDPAGKYPVIILYYFQYSQYLHAYWVPDYFSNAFTDIPWLVSRGYLVFTPDIYFTNDRPRPASAWNTVEGAGLYLKMLPYVDSTLMGISGHSRAGGYTNYIITHSTQFAAAFEGAGVSNWVSAQHTLIYTSGQVRSTSGQEPFIFTNKTFLADNPILNADKITSPLLIFHNKLDAAVPWEQGAELYIAMRRLGKPVWMLQYDGQGHSLSQKKTKEDLTIRVTQFFDHYLKGAPAPVWMTRGVPARLKGVETGLELDESK